MTPVKDLVVKPKAEVVPEFVPFDPWNPVLLNSPSLHTTPEQDTYIKEILEICCSDSAFAKKAYKALQYILTGAAAEPILLSSISPTTAVVDAPVTLVVTGTGFTETSVIMFGGQVPTTFVSSTELSASVTAPSVEGVVAVSVINAEEVPSNSIDFTVTPIVEVLNTPTFKKEIEVKKEEKK